MTSTVKPERTGWRDEGLSARHRKWGWDCPAIDIDFLMLEYDNGEPVAIIEYKHERAAAQHPTHPSYRALRSLADKASVLFLGVRYADDFSWFRILPINSVARGHLSYQYHTMTEGEYVAFLYGLRGREAPPDMFLDEGLEV